MGVISLLSDFGLRDPYVSQMKAVILSISPNSTIIDISHDIEKYDVRMGAYILASSMTYFPEGSVFVAVVDPGVGESRRAIIIKTGKSFLVGPDNGILMLGAEFEGVKAVYEISDRRYMCREVSATFHGRDVFAPVAAYLCEGVAPEKIGRRICDYFQPTFSRAEVRRSELYGEVVHVDSFGNVITNISGRELVDKVSVGDMVEANLADRRFRLKFHRTYSDVEVRFPLALIGSHGFLEFAINQGSAVEMMGVRRGDVVRVRLL